MCTKEVKEYVILRMTNSTPKEDKIASKVIKKVWLILKKHITSFFDICLHNKHHSQYFKLSIFCALPKSGKKICSEPKSYCLIALLLYLEKVQKRVVVRQFIIFVFKIKLFSNLYFGTISGRFALNAAATFTHNVEKAMHKKNVLTALTFDIKSAFDNISKNKLIKQL